MRQHGQEAVLGLVDLGQALVGLGQLGGPCLDALFQLVVEIAQLPLVLSGQEVAAPLSNRATDSLLEILDHARLDEIVVGPAAQSGDRRFERGVSGEHDAERARRVLADLAQQVDAIHPGQLELGQKNVVGLCPQSAEGIAGA